MAHSHVQPKVRNGIGEWVVMWRLPLTEYTSATRRKSDRVSTQRFPIADGVSAEKAWEKAFKFASRVYKEGFVEVPEMPDVDWKALGVTTNTTRKQRYADKTAQAESLFQRGYDPIRVAVEVGTSVSTAYRWRAAWKKKS